MDELDVRAAPGGVTLPVRVKPRSSRSRVLGVRERALEVAVAAPPVDGAANDELRAVLAKYFGVSRSAVTLVSGETGRNKRVELRGASVAEVLAKVGAGS